MDEAMLWDEEGWKCRKHPSRPRRGVCPHCLRDRLLRLCPDCAHVRPCACLPSSSSSSSSLSSSDLVSRSDRVSASDRIARPSVGAVGRVAQLLEGEPAFRRSSSSAVPFLRQRSDAEGTAEARARWWGPIWLFGSGATASRKEAAMAVGEVAAKMGRSRSVVVESYPRDRGVGGEKKGGGGQKAKGWGWYFPSPMWAFKHRKSAKIVQERSPTSQS